MGATGHGGLGWTFSRFMRPRPMFGSVLPTFVEVEYSQVKESLEVGIVVLMKIYSVSASLFAGLRSRRCVAAVRRFGGCLLQLPISPNGPFMDWVSVDFKDALLGSSTSYHFRTEGLSPNRRKHSPLGGLVTIVRAFIIGLLCSYLSNWRFAERQSKSEFCELK